MIANLFTTIAPNKPTVILTGAGEAGQITTEEFDRLRQELRLDAPWYMRKGLFRVLGIVAVVGIAAYFWLLTGILGQTLGKLALRIQVVDSQGTVPGLGRAALRELLAKHVLYWLVIASLVIAFLIFALSLAVVAALLALGLTVVGVLAFLWMTWDQRKQGWHDKLARTYVVKKPRP